MTRAVLTLRDAETREKAKRWVDGVPPGTRLEFKAPRRTIPQNSLMWQRLTDISKQLVWHHEQLSPEDWKTVLMAAYRKTRIVPGADGGFVQIGVSTSDLSKEEMTEFLDLISAFAATHGVELTDEERLP